MKLQSPPHVARGVRVVVVVVVSRGRSSAAGWWGPDRSALDPLLIGELRRRLQLCRAYSRSGPADPDQGVDGLVPQSRCQDLHRPSVSKQAAAKRCNERTDESAAEPRVVLPKSPAGWAVTTRRGHTLLRVIRQHSQWLSVADSLGLPTSPSWLSWSPWGARTRSLRRNRLRHSGIVNCGVVLP